MASESPVHQVLSSRRQSTSFFTCAPSVPSHLTHTVLSQDLDTVHASHEEARDAVRSALNAPTLRDALRRLLPRPARLRYVCVMLLPQAPLAARVVRRVPLRRAK